MAAQERIDVVIIEDHAMVAEGLRAALATQHDLEVKGIAGSLAEGLLAVRRLQPDVVLMDHRLPDGNGAGAAESIRQAAPGAAVLVITADVGPEVVADALASGCAGVLAKGATIEQVARGIRDVHRGEGVFSTSMLASARRREVPALTDREVEVLRLLHAGATTAQIAASLVLSVHTVRNHVRNLTAKLGAHTRLEALARARELGVLEGGALALR